MDQQPSNPNPITEADLIGWVEGTLPAARDRMLRAELTRNPALALRLQAMTQDRAILTSIPDEPAPAALLAAVQEAIERQTLFADAPALKIDRPSRWSRWALRPNMAMAAGVALVITGGVYWAMVFSNASPVVRNMPSHDVPSVAVGPTTQNPEPRNAANGGSSGVTEIAPVLASDTTGELLPMQGDFAYSGSDTQTLALAEAVMKAESGPPRRPLDARTAELRRALELAEQGRLVIRVRTPAGTRVAGKMDALAASASRRDPVRAWRVEGDVPPALLASLTNAGPMTSLEERTVTASPTLASSEPQDVGRQAGVTVPTRVVRDTLPAVSSPAAACMAEFRPTAPTLQALVAALSQKLGGEVILSEASSPQPITSDPADASSVVWWTQPPGTWGKWITVPVVVESNR